MLEDFTAGMVDDVCGWASHVASQHADVYPLEPDSRLLLRLVAQELQSAPSGPAVAIEVGCGTGACASLISRLTPTCCVFATDISLSAIRAAADMAAGAQAAVELARMDLLSGMRAGSADLICFLPPYVPTSETQLARSRATAAIASRPLDRDKRVGSTAPAKPTCRCV